MQPTLGPGFQTRAKKMGVSVAAEQGRLKKEQASGPNTRAPPEPGKDEFPDQGLDLKQEKRAKEDRQGMEYHRQGADMVAGPGMKAMTIGAGDVIVAHLRRLTTTSKLWRARVPAMGTPKALSRYLAGFSGGSRTGAPTHPQSWGTIAEREKSALQVNLPDPNKPLSHCHAAVGA
ncbi:MAG: hypothetical protein KBA71_10155 [Opitutaceae bacterium]|nr:hypothetical protein [Opitutaceae bacterium]